MTRKRNKPIRTYFDNTDDCWVKVDDMGGGVYKLTFSENGLIMLGMRHIYPELELPQDVERFEALCDIIERNLERPDIYRDYEARGQRAPLEPDDEIPF
jgi:hypothetical protein